MLLVLEWKCLSLLPLSLSLSPLSLSLLSLSLLSLLSLSLSTLSLSLSLSLSLLSLPAQWKYRAIEVQRHRSTGRPIGRPQCSNDPGG